MRLRDFATASRLIAVLGSVAVAACGGSEPGPGPNPSAVRIHSVSPASGSTFGGTIITIAGEGFQAGASVQVGGTAATDVVALNSTTITAKTAARAAGVADVRVTSGGSSANLANAFTFVAPSIATNAPPIINSVTVRMPRTNQPTTLANISDRLIFTASVSDTETPNSQLTFEWTAVPNIGTLSGSGISVEWLAPASLSSSQTVAFTVTVVERYQDADAQGLPVQREHRVQRVTEIRVHDSVSDIGTMARAFLVAFSEQKPASDILRDFSRTCDGGRGYTEELADVERHQREFTVRSFNIGAPSVTLAFGSAQACAARDGTPGDACATLAVRWDDTEKSTGRQATVNGTGYVSAVYESSRWFLCHSKFTVADSLTGQRAIR
ncbi:MAG: IPT/TIG domain-containing protein [Vicinamibacterales bacterium]